MTSSHFVTVRSSHQHHLCSQPYWRMPTVPDTKAPRRPCTVSVPTYTLRARVARCTISCTPVKSANATRESNSGQPAAIWARHHHGFCQRFSVHQREVYHPQHRRTTVEVRAFHPIGTPLHGDIGGMGFLRQHARLDGIPSSIVSDRDVVFTSTFRKKLFTLVGVTLQMSSTFHTQSNDQSKATNKIIMMYLRCLTGNWTRQWLRWLLWVEFCYNSTYHSSLRTSSLRVVYGVTHHSCLPTRPMRPSCQWWTVNFAFAMSF
jgi:hypothetical protein